MPTIEMLKGLPASGKSTYAKKKVSENTNQWKRLNKDDMRAMFDDGKHSKGNENQILQIRNDLVRYFIKNGKNVIVDDTNLAPYHEKTLRELAKELGCSFKVNDSFMNVDVSECVKRDLKRFNSVGKDVIYSHYNKWVKGRSKRYHEYNYKHQDQSLPACLICDLDGTLFWIDDSVENSRSPYDMTRVDEDKVNYPVKVLIDVLSSNLTNRKQVDEVIFVSGRSSDGREKSEQAIKDLFGESGQYFKWKLLMRKEGDFRKDVIVKQEIFRKHIEGKYWVRFVFDDRQQTVDGFRELGLPVFQVAKGDF